MKCPSCGSEIADEDAAFCPRCASPLGSDQAEATEQLEAVGAPDQSDDATAKLAAPAPGTDSAEPPGAEPSTTRADEISSDEAPRLGAGIAMPAAVRRLELGRWLDAAAAAGLAFLVVLAIGAALTLAAKLNFPSLGGGANPLSAFTAFVLAGLGSLGIPIVIDGVAVSALPLGAVTVAGIGFTWAVRSSLRDTPPRSLPAAIVVGARMALPFALLCWFFALVFRFRGQHPVNADGGIALVAGAFWGGLFGIVGALTVLEPLRETAGRLLAGLRARQRDWYEGVVAGASIFSFAALLGLAAMLLWIIVSLARGAPGRHFGAGDAFAYLVYIAAFLPNIVVAIVSFSLGAPFHVGAKIDLGGELVGPMREYSLSAWGRGDPLPVLWLLLLIPIAACAAGGFLARRRASGSEQMIPVLLAASSVFSIALTLLAGIGELRLAGVVRGSGYGAVAPDLLFVLLFAFLACGILSFAGWKLAESTTVLDHRFPQH